MIVKIKLSATTPTMALIYPQDCAWLDHTPTRYLPAHVIDTVRKKGGQAYFHATDRERHLIFGPVASGQDW